MDRRAFLGYTTLAAAGAFSSGLFTPASAQDILGLPASPIAKTAYGQYLVEIAQEQGG